MSRPKRTRLDPSGPAQAAMNIGRPMRGRRGTERATPLPTFGACVGPGENGPMTAPLVVQKIGGASLADADRIRRVARRIARERSAGADLVVVVSAMGDAADELPHLAPAITRAA